MFNDYSTIVSETKYKTYREGIRILTPKQIIQRIPIATAQLKVSSTSETLLNEIRHITCSLHRAKEITKKFYKTIICPVKVVYLHRLLLNLTYKIILKRSDTYATLSNLSIYYTRKNIKKSYENN